MGGIVSSTQPLTLESHLATARRTHYGQARAEYAVLVDMVMPSYFVRSPVTDELLASARTAWTSILNNSASRYKRECRHTEFEDAHPTALQFFTETFFARLFDVHPEVIPTLSKVKDREAFMRNMMEFALSDPSDQSVFENALEHFAEIHHKRGVRASECKQFSPSLSISLLIKLLLNFNVDGVVGEVLMYSLTAVLGPIAFSPDVEHAWIVIYSRILDTVIPIAIALDMNTKDRNNSGNRSRQTEYYEVVRSSST